MDVNVDNLRFVSNTNTQVRSLRIVTQIIKSVDNKHLPKDFLKSKLIEWSMFLEKQSEEYRSHNGKLTEGETPTVAFNRYIELIDSFGLVSSLGSVFINTRLGNLLCLLTEKKDDFDFTLSHTEKIFYLNLLFSKDADTCILVLEILLNRNEPLIQSEVLKEFEKFIKERLLVKQKIATTQAKVLITEKYIAIEHEWEKIEVYAEHIIVPRLEWLTDIGLVKMSQRSGKTFYEITPKGKHLYNSLLLLPDSNIKDINEQWLYEKAFKSFAGTIYKKSTLIFWKDIAVTEKKQLLGNLLLSAYKNLSIGSAMRMALYPSLLYIALTLLCEKHIIIELKDIILELKEAFEIHNKAFFVRPAARINEGYIMVKVI